MSGLQRLMPYIVAGITGVASGIYIFKPMLQKPAENTNWEKAPLETPQPPATTLK